MPSANRRATSMTMDSQLLDDARALGVNVSRAAEAGLTMALKEAREAAWKRDNAAAIAYWNTYVEENGLPLADMRQF
jgi:antitoxin CcdA